MIPSIETIVEDLLIGKITKQQAIGWLHQHAESAGYDLRDEFAANAMQGRVWEGLDDDELIAQRCYEIADAMLAHRQPRG